MQTRLEAEVENFSINIESLKKKFFVKKEAEFAFVDGYRAATQQFLSEVRQIDFLLA